mmetsp:Transcript_64679/g.140897  ORF Transcript_64679/g.140897 Transcript_64679/m.140897 type:complete len:163 (-) Transcript_64679:121-609(-)
MSNLYCTTARNDLSGSQNSDAVHRRSAQIMNLMHRQERRSVHDLTRRIDLEATSRQSMTTHLSQAGRSYSAKAAHFRARNDLWAARAEEAVRWRQACSKERLERCSSAVELKDRKYDDLMHWHQRVLVDTPAQLLEHRSALLASSIKSSRAEVDRHHKLRLG